MNNTLTSGLKEQWQAFRLQNPKTRIRDAARALQVSEGQLVAACTGATVAHLRNDFPALLQRMPGVGKVMVLTRNESCVIERKGIFEDVRTGSRHVGVVVGKDIDLRMFFSKWVHGFAVRDDEALGFKNSLQVFDGQGNAVIKIYALAETNLPAWEQLVHDFTAAAQPAAMAPVPAPAPPANAQNVDVAAFLEDWAALQDTHDFFPMLSKYKVGRLHALEMAAGRFTQQVHTGCVKTLLTRAAADGQEIMVFVGNHGNIEIHTGPVQKIVEIPGWINVMDADFNLHLKTTDINQCWVVEKPSADGIITAVEVFDNNKEMIVQFFGKRKPGQPEQQQWRALVGECKM
ncbi:MAG TPA: ChuX/HutX family heme-like substrate-binding protein [Chitinophaga sp.]|uniref:hemin-degrading factor n=1 Tax=Chitinophaga sp. TaxID=1869181 RepID=UPI002DBE7B36|nr:ChuX/HutX family heme-like substrate-binding protein [Chitinophaga sp.]HEU4555869.1 ChuX/HutX family heme-like substrate-binding protein [Chitinophaga sp.]